MAFLRTAFAGKPLRRSAGLALLANGRFDGSPDALRYLGYTERGTFNSFPAEELLKEFHDPQAVRAVLAKYHAPMPPA